MNRINSSLALEAVAIEVDAAANAVASDSFDDATQAVIDATRNVDFATQRAQEENDAKAIAIAQAVTRAVCGDAARAVFIATNARATPFVSQACAAELRSIAAKVRHAIEALRLSR